MTIRHDYEPIINRQPAFTCVFLSVSVFCVSIDQYSSGCVYASSLKVAPDRHDKQLRNDSRDKVREDTVVKPCRETGSLRDTQCKQGKPEHRAEGCR